VARSEAAQRAIDDAFDASSAYWRQIYGERSFLAAVYADRQAAALAWIDELGLPRGAAVLEVGCGAGFLTVELAERGYRVDAIDSSDAMVASTRARIAEAGADASATASVDDVHHLSARDGAYAAVLALGVLPWLHAPARAVRELARVVAPGGAVIVTADNRARLNFVLDPRFNPVLVYPVKRRLKALLGRLGKRPLGVLPDVCYPGALDRLVRAAGLEPRRRLSVGFGPFTFLGVGLLSEARSVALHRRLQRLADRGVPLLRAAGMNAMVLATKPR
jgi:2-polyprenyl-3-methyl-5-hydroxy-6-metoxy-1,4-benzoquinol methylase